MDECLVERAAPERRLGDVPTDLLDAQGQLTPVPSVSEWGLTSEPFVFTVGRDGIVKRAFNGMPSEQELQDAIAELTAAP